MSDVIAVTCKDLLTWSVTMVGWWVAFRASALADSRRARLALSSQISQIRDQIDTARVTDESPIAKAKETLEMLRKAIFDAEFHVSQKNLAILREVWIYYRNAVSKADPIDFGDDHFMEGLETLLAIPKVPKPLEKIYAALTRMAELVKG